MVSQVARGIPHKRSDYILHGWQDDDEDETIPYFWPSSHCVVGAIAFALIV